LSWAQANLPADSHVAAMLEKLNSQN
jgi:hypothetical protein